MKKRTTTTPVILCAAVILLYAPAGLAETATIVSSAHLHQGPAYEAPVIGQLDAGQPVELKRRSGGWKMVGISNNSDSENSTSNMSGWVRSYQVRSGTISVATEEESSGGILGGLASLSRKVSGLFSSSSQDDDRTRGGAVATIGVRGLSEEEIKNAKPDFRELEKMEKFRIYNNAAKRYARDGQRKPIQLAHMPRSAFEE